MASSAFPSSGHRLSRFAGGAGLILAGVAFTAASTIAAPIGGLRNSLAHTQYQKMYDLLVEVQTGRLDGPAFSELHAGLKKHYPDRQALMALMQTLDLTPEASVIKFNRFQEALLDPASIEFLSAGRVPPKFQRYYKISDRFYEGIMTPGSDIPLIGPGGFTEAGFHWASKGKQSLFASRFAFEQDNELSQADLDILVNYDKALSRIRLDLGKVSKGAKKSANFLMGTSVLAKLLRARAQSGQEYEVNPDFISADPYLAYHFQDIHEIFPEPISNEDWSALEREISNSLIGLGSAGSSLLKDIFKGQLSDGENANTQSLRKRLVRVWRAAKGKDDAMNSQDSSTEGSATASAAVRFANLLIENNERCSDGLSRALYALESIFIHGKENEGSTIGMKISQILSHSKMAFISQFEQLDKDPEFRTTIVEVLSQKLRLTLGLPVDERAVSYAFMANLRSHQLTMVKVMELFIHGDNENFFGAGVHTPGYSADTIADLLENAYLQGFNKKSQTRGVPTFDAMELQTFARNDPELAPHFAKFVDQLTDPILTEVSPWFSVDPETSQILFSRKFFKILAFKHGFLVPSCSLI